MTARYAAALSLVIAAALGAQQPSPPPPAAGQAASAEQPEQPLPRFRAGANLVRVDAYVTRDGQPVTDLTAADFEVFEDDAAQRVESLELIQPRGPVPDSARVEPNTVGESRAMAAEPDARLFVLFMDVWHVHLAGSHNARRPIINLLDRVIGQDDLVGVMTPEMSARNLTLARRTRTIEGILTNNWFWGERDAVNSSDPREEEIKSCYPDIPGSKTAGLANDMIARRRERKTLDAINDLIVHLEGIREERKFVIMLSEGWLSPPPNDNLGRMVESVPGREPLTVGPGGLQRGDPRQMNDYERCDRERLRLAAEDLRRDFQDMLQRANRANISFYPVDPRGLVAFDQDIGPRRPPGPIADAWRLGTRHDSLRALAENTDGAAVLNTNNLDKALERVLQDVGAYYLLGYYSTNTRLDGRFRKIRVRVKRPGLEVRARPGYLAPTEAEAASARVDALMNGTAPGDASLPPGVARALETLAPVRGVAPVRLHATAGAGMIWITGELDATTQKDDVWRDGGQARVRLEHERGATAPIEVDVTLAPGERVFALTQPAEGTLPPGRYVIRAQLTAAGSAVPLQTVADVTVPASEALLSPTAIVTRRGPSTGLAYVATADASFRRTERLRLEIPRFAAAGAVSAQLLGRDGQPLSVPVTLSERVRQQTRMIVADLTLAPLAQGEYVLAIALEHDGKKESATFGFRVVP